MADALYDLGRDDPDRGMGSAMQHDVVELPECPAGLLQRAFSSGDKLLVRLVERKRLISELELGLTRELFERCLASQQPTVQRALIAHPDVSREQLERLAAQGLSRSIRNLARAKMAPR